MPTTYTDQFFVMDPGVPPAAGTALTVVKRDMVDQNDNNFINTGTGDTVNGVAVTSVWVGDTITVVMNGASVTITGVTFYLASGPAIFTPTDGTILSNATFQSSTFVTSSTQAPVGGFGPPCFARGTRIAVPGGKVAIETLKPGDLVETQDHGPQPLRWIGQRRVAATGDYAPIRFAPGAIGNDRALLVSPQHRMMIAGWMAELFFGEGEVLVAAGHLVGAPGISRRTMAEICYVHLLFDRHEIVFAEGAPSESFHPDSLLLERDRALRAEIAGIFPELDARIGTGQAQTVRRVIRAHEARVLAA